ncbi:MAG TPA: sulfotransferase, partial [Streptosporangiaceae bacterium]
DGAHFVKQCQRFGISFGELARTVRAVRRELGSDLVSLPDRCVLIDRLGNLRREQAGASRWGIKLQRRISDVGSYARLWPRARFIHIVRDGRDLAASHLVTVPDWGFKTIREAARGWLDVVARPHTVAPAGRYLEIRYEDMVTDLKGTTRTLTDFLGVEWHDSLLRHDAAGHSLFAHPWGHPAARAASRPVSPGQVGRYRSDLTRQQIAEFESIAGAELARLGYLTG